MRRRHFLLRVASSIAAGAGLLVTRSGPAVQRVVEQSPRYLWDPERQVMTERIKDGVYRVMTTWKPQ